MMPSAAKDLTLVNLRALKKRLDALERFRKDDRRRIDLLERGATILANRLADLSK
jgi:Flp pilus assembly CpaE family ATPase